MLLGLDPSLSGGLLARLDQMGHLDTVAVLDAQFLAHRLGAGVLDLADAGGLPVAIRGVSR